MLSLRGLFIWLITAIFFMYEFLLRTVVGTFQHPIMYDLHINAVTFALISSTAYQLVYGLMQIPVGIITDKYGLKWSLFGACLVCCLAAFGLSHSHGAPSAIVFRILMGFGSAFGFVCMLVAVYDWLPQNRTALYIGISQFIGTMGPMLAAGPVKSLADNSILSWRTLFFDLSIVGLGLSFLVLCFVKNNREKFQHGFKLLVLDEPLLINLKRIFMQKQAWYIAVYSALVYVFLEYISENDGIAFLVTKGIEPAFAAYCISFAWIGYAIGCPLLGFISDFTNRRKKVLQFAASLLLVTVCLIIYCPLSSIFMGISFLFLGLAASGPSVAFAIMAEQCQEKYLAAGLGFNNAAITLCGGLLAPILSKFLSLLTGTEAATLANYQVVYGVIVVFAIIGIVLSSFFIKETYCKSMRKPVVLHY